MDFLWHLFLRVLLNFLFLRHRVAAGTQRGIRGEAKRGAALQLQRGGKALGLGSSNGRPRSDSELLPNRRESRLKWPSPTPTKREEFMSTLINASNQISNYLGSPSPRRMGRFNFTFHGDT